MSRTYKATGINLKSMPLGESDRLLTILTPEFGLIRAVAPGARKHKSKLGGRSGLFVVNDLLIAQGRSLDKIIQAETLESYPGLGKDLLKLSASQYLAEIVLCQALSDQPQAELYAVLNEHLRRLEELPNQTDSNNSLSSLLSHLSHGVFHLLAMGGIAPQVHLCCLTQNPLTPDFTIPDWKVGFSLEGGGTVNLSALDSSQTATSLSIKVKNSSQLLVGVGQNKVQQVVPSQPPPKVNSQLNALELALLQQLTGTTLPELPNLSEYSSTDRAWLSIERILRQYTQYHLGRSIRSAALMEACFPY